MATMNYDASGIHPVRGMLWKLLQTEFGWKKEDYGGLIPVLTPQQQPEMNEIAKPYLVYNYSHQMSDVDYYINEEQATFLIYSGTADSGEDDIRRVINLMREAFKGMDDSARMLNDWIANSPDSNAEFKKFDFKWIRIVSTIGAGPAQEEGGKQSGMVTIRYRYTYTDPANGGQEGRIKWNRFSNQAY